MLIKTGLVPTIKVITVPVVSSDLTLSPLAASLSSEASVLSHQEMWLVDLATAQDTPVAQRGTVTQRLLLDSEPSTRARMVKLQIPADAGKDFASGQFDFAVREHGIPKDATVEEHWLGSFSRKEQIIRWYELEV